MKINKINKKDNPESQESIENQELLGNQEEKVNKLKEKRERRVTEKANDELNKYIWDMVNINQICES